MGIVHPDSILCVFGLLFVFAKLIDPLKKGISTWLADYIYSQPPQVVIDAEPETSIPEECSIFITGRITRNDGAPIVNAEIKIINTGLYDSGVFRNTDNEGKFSYNELGINTCSKDKYFLFIKKNGYKPVFITAKPDEVLNISLSLLYAD